MTRTRPTDADLARWFVRTQQALGYPLAWIAAHTGTHVYSLVTEPAPLWVDAPDLDALAAFAAAHSTTAEHHGVPSEVAAVARADAQAAGYHPPACYDEPAGHPDLRSIPGNRWELWDRRGDDLVGLVEDLLDELPRPDILARRTMLNDGNVNKEARRLRLWYTQDPAALAAAQDRVDRMLAAAAAMFTENLAIALALDLVRPATVRRIPADHPGLIEYAQAENVAHDARARTVERSPVDAIEPPCFSVLVAARIEDDRARALVDAIAAA